MTARERKLVVWVRDLVDDASSGWDDMRYIRRADAAKKMLQRWLDKDAKHRGQA